MEKPALNQIYILLLQLNSSLIAPKVEIITSKLELIMLQK